MTYKISLGNTTGEKKSVVITKANTGPQGSRGPEGPEGPERRFIEVRLFEKNSSVSIDTSIGGDFRAPLEGIIEDVGAYVDVAGTGSGKVSVDININNVSIFSTNKIEIDVDVKNSEDSANQPILTNTNYSRLDIINFDVDTNTSTPPNGLTIWMNILVS